MNGIALNLEFNPENFETLKKEYFREKGRRVEYEDEMKKMVTYLKNELYQKDLEIRQLQADLSEARKFTQDMDRLSTAKSQATTRSDKSGGHNDFEAMLALEEENNKLKSDLEAYAYLKAENIELIETMERQKEELGKLRRLNKSKVERSHVEEETIREDMKKELEEKRMHLIEECYNGVKEASRKSIELNLRLSKHLKHENNNLYNCSERLRHSLNLANRQEVQAEQIQQTLKDREEKVEELSKKLEEQKMVVAEMTNRNFLAEFQVKKYNRRDSDDESVGDLKDLQNPSQQMKEKQITSIWKSSFGDQQHPTPNNQNNEESRDNGNMMNNGDLLDAPNSFNYNNNNNNNHRHQEDPELNDIIESISIPKLPKRKRRRGIHKESFNPGPGKLSMEQTRKKKDDRMSSKNQSTQRYTGFQKYFAKTRRTQKFSGNNKLHLFGVRKDKPRTRNTPVYLGP